MTNQAADLHERYETVIGLEIHCQLQTSSKIFSSASIAYGAEPNTQVAEVDLGLPGTLPVINRKVVELAVRAGLAMGCTIQPWSQFARKNYFYPDLPKGYQISQHVHPICTDGELEFELEDESLHQVRIERIHLEEDAGKSTHLESGSSVIDLNRAGTPLIEIVTRPDMRSPEQAMAAMKAVHAIVTALDVCDGNLEQGSFRCDANVSVRRHGSEELGTRTELKNINSFRFVRDAIAYEARRQMVLLEEGGAVVQQTRLYDPDRQETFAMRTKEESHDYRYFPEPDLPPLLLEPELIESAREGLPELPLARKRRYQESLGLSGVDATTLAMDRTLSSYFEEAIDSPGGDPQKIANWVINELLRELKGEDTLETIAVRPHHIAALIELIETDVISGKIAKKVFASMLETGQEPSEIVEEQGLRQLTDPDAIRPILEEILESHTDKVEEYRGGKTKLLGFFVGQAMRATQGKANPQLVQRLLREMLDES